MPYLIDGHNVIGQLADISLDDPHDEMKLVQKLVSFSARVKSKITVVFDKGIPASRQQWSSMVEVVFANHWSNADRVMIERIRVTKDSHYWTVVSSDRYVLDAARQYRMKTMRSAEFATVLSQKHGQINKQPWKMDSQSEDGDKTGNEHVSPEDVRYWLSVFNETPSKKKPRKN